MPRALTGQWNPADARASSLSMMETSAPESMNVAGVCDRKGTAWGTVQWLGSQVLPLPLASLGFYWTISVEVTPL